MQDSTSFRSEPPRDPSSMGPNPRPLVTIGIPTFNRADSYLPESLGSALGQDYPNLEVIVSDNGSSDGTEVFVKSLNDPRVRYF